MNDVTIKHSSVIGNQYPILFARISKRKGVALVSYLFELYLQTYRSMSSEHCHFTNVDTASGDGWACWQISRLSPRFGLVPQHTRMNCWHISTESLTCCVLQKHPKIKIFIFWEEKFDVVFISSINMPRRHLRISLFSSQTLRHWRSNGLVIKNIQLYFPLWILPKLCFTASYICMYLPWHNRYFHSNCEISRDQQPS